VHLSLILAFLAAVSLALNLWQWFVARRFPLHRRVTDDSFPPAVTLLKPLKGCDGATEACLRSWLEQQYTGRLQVLFAVASADDPICAIVRKLLAEFRGIDAELVVSGPLTATNAKVAKLVLLQPLAKHDLVIISDADVRAPPDLLVNVVAPLREPTVGLVNCFYRIANPSTLAMRWEAVAINADFWSQVLQSKSLKPLDFALGAVMATRLKHLRDIGGFSALANCLADDYQLGNRIARQGYRVALCPVVVECWSASMGWAAVWKHQLRWARTIRVCQPWPYFFSILSNATCWPLLWVAISPTPPVLAFSLTCWALRIATAFDLQRRLDQTCDHSAFFWLPPVKDIIQAIIWLLAFLGNRVEWRGERLTLRPDGTLVK
jgi:ceramide glucosyltransferase